MGAFNFGFSYFHTQEYNPLIKRGDLTGAHDPITHLPIREYDLVHPNKDIFGAYGNTQLTGNTPIPGVLRVEAIYVPNQPFNTFSKAGVFPDPIVPLTDAIVRRDYVKYLVAYDLNGLLYFQWHKDASFDITLEHVGEVVPNNRNLQYLIFASELRKWNSQFNLRIGTAWRYGQISTEIITSYLPCGRSGLIMPIVKYTPPWLNQRLSFELRYINVFGKNTNQGLGILRSKDMIVLTSQFNW